MVIAVEGTLLQQQAWSFADVSRIRVRGSSRERRSVVSIATSQNLDFGRSVCVSRLGEVITSSRLSSQHVGTLTPFELWAGRPQANSILGVTAAGPVNASIAKADGPELKWWEKGSARNVHDVHSRQEFLDGLSEAEDKLGYCLSSLEVASEDVTSAYGVPKMVVALSGFLICPGPADASTLNPAYGDVGALLEAGVQLIYLGALLVLLGVGSFLVVRQVLIKRELETAAKDLQERVRTGDASSLEYFELGAVMLRKKYYQLANKYLDQAIKKWDGSEQDLAQVYNALGFSYFSDGKVEKSVAQYEKAVQLQPGYVIAWNNLADAYENQKEFSKALKAYELALQLDPTNKVASARKDMVKTKVDRYQGIP